MDQVLQQLGIERIFSAPYHPPEQLKTRSLTQVFETNIEETL